MRKGFAFLLLLISCNGFASEAQTSHQSSLSRSAVPVPDNLVGVGLLYGNAGESREYRLLLEGQNHFKQRMGAYHLRQYGHGQARLEVGNGLGVHLAATSGITLVGLGHEGWFSPHIGVEPMSGRLVLDSNRAIESSYEWMPMVSAGPQFGTGSCRFLPLLRAGPALGNLGKEGWGPSLRVAYGAGTYLNCSRLDLAAEITRLRGQVNDVDLGVADIAYEVKANALKVGLRGESVETHGESERTEQRVLLILRGQFEGWD